MLNIFYRCLPLYYLLAAVALGLSLAWLVSGEVESRLDDMSASAAGAVARQADDGAVSITDTDGVILKRNMFSASLAHSATTEGTADHDADTQPSAAHNAALVGTIVAGDASLAVIRCNNKDDVYRLDARLPTGAIVKSISTDHVMLRVADGTMRQLSLKARHHSSAGVVAGGVVPLVAAGEIKKVADNSWVISRRAADKLRANIATLVQQILVTPKVANGRTYGFVVRQVQPHSVFAQMDLRRGDVLHAVNGVALDSPEKGLQIFQQLREARRIEVDLERGVQPLKFKYEIR